MRFGTVSIGKELRVLQSSRWFPKGQEAAGSERLLLDTARLLGILTELMFLDFALRTLP